MKQMLTIILVSAALCGCGKAPQEESFRMSETSARIEVYRGAFGTCCEDLKHCMRQPNCLFHVSEDGSFFMTIGYFQTEEGTGWLDHAVVFCPFCGKKLQDRRQLAGKVKDK